ncbi:MAG TPA: DUF3375 domain-containing protein [Dermatophilaceae bacterium]|nr:DUF3375 domain-containing protein [Dermatophilaceae bacterium]
MDHETAAYLRARSGAWRLLRADTAPLILHVLGQIFIVDNVRTIAEPDLLARIDDLLYAANASSAGDGEPAYPRSARAYLGTWADPDQGWLRKYYPEGSQVAHYDATVDVEKAYAFVSGLGVRSFIGTQSRLQTIVELLRDIVAGADPDPTSQLRELQRRRDELDAQIASFGGATPTDAVVLLDRYQHLASTARELLSDFRAVEENFRALDRGIRADIAAWDGSKGELLDQILGERHAIAESDQGRSFQAFYDFLLSRTRRDELTDLLDRLVKLDVIDVDRSLGRVHFDWLDAAERTQQTVRALSEQLRRFLDDKVWLENRRVVELLRSLERTALTLRDTTPDLSMDLEASSPRVFLPFERPLYAPPTFDGVDSVGPLDDDQDSVEWGALFEQVYVDAARLVTSVRDALSARDQVALSQVLAAHPVSQGVAELVAYLALTEDDFEVLIDDTGSEVVVVTDVDGRVRTVRMPQVLLVRTRAGAVTGR